MDIKEIIIKKGIIKKKKKGKKKKGRWGRTIFSYLGKQFVIAKVLQKSDLFLGNQ